MLLVTIALLPALAAAPGVGAGRAAAQAVSRPNVLIIVTDDQRYEGSMGLMPKTRRWFGAGGTEFTQGFVTTPLCCPSRSTIFSGRYAHNHRVLTNLDPPSLLDMDGTMQRYLHDAGYRTAIAGKVLNYWKVEWDAPHFDRWATLRGEYFDTYWNLDGTVKKVSGYTTDQVKGHAVRFLRWFETADAQPWFLYVAVHAPHKDYLPAPKYADAPVPTWGPLPSVYETDRSDKPPWSRWAWTPDRVRPIRDAQLRTLMSVDDLVGRVSRELRSLDETNTLAFFLSDNGLLWGEHGIGANKRFPYTESIQVPFFVRWPGHLAAGASDDRFATNVDILPTVLEATGVSPDLVYPLDGRSLLQPGSRNRLFLEYFVSSDLPGVPSWASIRNESYQYVEWYDALGNLIFREYYDLVEDPYQLVNLLHDGNTENDPDVSAIAAQLDDDRECAGTACP